MHSRWYFTMFLPSFVSFVAKFFFVLPAINLFCSQFFCLLFGQAHRNNNEILVHESNFHCKKCLFLEIVFNFVRIYSRSLSLAIQSTQQSTETRENNKIVCYAKRHHCSYRLTFTCSNHVRSCFMRETKNVPFYQHWQAKKRNRFYDYFVFFFFILRFSRASENMEDEKSHFEWRNDIFPM